MRSLTGQWIALTLVALAASQIFFYYIYRTEQARTVLELRRDEFLARAAAVARLIETVEPALHPEILRATTTGVVRFWTTDSDPVEMLEWQQTAAGKLLESTRPPEASLLPPQPRARWHAPQGESRFSDPRARMTVLRDWNGFGLVVPINDGLWLNAVYAKPGAVSGPPWYHYLSLAIAAVLLTLVSVLLVRRLARPLRRLTDSAERLGRGEEVPALPEEGADDVRHLTAAFNRMQSRLRRYVEDRTRMVAAISHDLRTPITSMRLRAEFIDDEETRSKMISTLDEMKAMSEATLAFAREESVTEETRSIDMNALLGSLCADLSELGWQVSFREGERTVWRCRPEALRRAVRNVIENAVRYGGQARVAFSAADDGLEVVVEDDGPGIPKDQRDRVFDPFVRLENSRNRETGGAGLGLSIARSIVTSHGGEILLMEGAPFRVRLYLPLD